MPYFIKYDSIRLSTAYETKEHATEVRDAMASLRQFTIPEKTIAKKEVKRLNPDILTVVEGEINAAKRGHKNIVLEDINEDAVRQLKNLQSIISKSKRKHKEEQVEDYCEIENMKAIHGSAWEKYVKDKDGICLKDEERYRYRFKVSKKPSLKEIIRFTGLNVYQVYVLQEKTKLYPEPKITKDKASSFMRYVSDTGDDLSNGLNFYDDTYLEEYSLSF